MKEYLAKSNPKETIEEHTKGLLENFETLKKLYPNESFNWELLYYACLYHDLGKMNPKFQEKIRIHKKVLGEIPHNILSLAFINVDYHLENGFSKEQIRMLFHAVAYHHDRSTDFTDEHIEEEIELMQKEFESFKFDTLEQIIFIDDYIDDEFFQLNDRIYEENVEFFDYVMLKGLLNRLDYAASGHIDVEIKNDFLIKSMDKLLEAWEERDSESKWNKLQNYMIENREENVITIAQTGMGKTEAGLLWIGDNKGFFTLPLKTAINEIYKRITDGIVNDREKVGLLHSETYSKYLEKEEDIKDIQEYFNKTKQLSLPLTVCTLDQIFDFVYRYRDFEPKLATLSYSKVVIDEIQMYSPDLLAYLIFGLDYITKVGGKFAILTATFPKFIEDILVKRGVEFKKSEVDFINEEIRHSLVIIKTQLDTKKVIENFNNNKILIVCNTVRKAQEIYDELKKSGINKKALNLLHSKFVKHDRAKKEKTIMKLGKLKNKESGIWIGTQVVEASLDIDFDLLFTELSDINGLFQRLGRCYRKREFKEENEYNCYVYVGEEEIPCSGIRNSDRSIIDIDIFNLSRKALLENRIKGALSEEDKLKIINQIYKTEKLKDTKYYEKLQTGLRYLTAIDAHEFSKSEVKKRFRDIQNVTVIPKPLFEKNKTEIEELHQEINRKLRDDEDKTERKNERYKLLDKLRGYTASVSWGEANKFISESSVLEIGKYEKFYILGCDYSFERGISLKKKQIKNMNSDDIEFDSNPSNFM